VVIQIIKCPLNVLGMLIHQTSTHTELPWALVKESFSSTEIDVLQDVDKEFDRIDNLHVSCKCHTVIMIHERLKKSVHMDADVIESETQSLHFDRIKVRAKGGFGGQDVITSNEAIWEKISVKNLKEYPGARLSNNLLNLSG
jgi:hypothetical protein